MLRQLQTTLPQHLGTVDHGMHQNVLAQHEHLHILPGAELAFWQRRAVLHDAFVLCALLLVYEISDQHIQCLLTHNEAAQGLQDLFVRLCVDPVITVYNFKINTGCCPQSCVYGLTMTAVLLMDRTADTRIACLVLVRDLGSVVLDRAVIYDQDLHLISARKQGLNAVSHVGF